MQRVRAKPHFSFHIADDCVITDRRFIAYICTPRILLLLGRCVPPCVPCISIWTCHVRWCHSREKSLFPTRHWQASLLPISLDWSPLRPRLLPVASPGPIYADANATTVRSFLVWPSLSVPHRAQSYTLSPNGCSARHPVQPWPADKNNHSTYGAGTVRARKQGA